MTSLRLLLPALMLAAACASTADPIHRNASGKDDGDTQNADPTQPGYNNPETPTNQGPSVNPTGFAAIAPLVQKQCGECHHAGTWLPLENGADQATARKMVAAIENGSMPPAPREKVAAEDLDRIKAWSSGQSPSASTASDAPSQLVVTQLLDAGTLSTYKAALPKTIAWKHLADVLAAPSTLFWDKATIPPAYQDTVGDGSSLPFGARFNNSGKSLIVPEGKNLFSADGSTWSYPFGHTAGADASTNTFIVNFLSFPEENGKLAPVVYKVETGTAESFPIKRWNWSFPKGAMVGEIIMLKDGSSLITSEIRVRIRQQDSWATNVFRPFPTAARLSSTIKSKNANWQSDASLSAVVTALDSTSLTTKSLGSPNFGNLVDLSGAVDAPLPTLDPAFAKVLLATTPFVGAYGTTYKTDGTNKAFGPTGPSSGTSVFPIGFDTGLLEVRESTCTKCHDQGGYFIGDLVDAAVLYGDIWGVDRVFSFHPFDPSRIDASGNENRSVRSGLASVVVPYDATAHANYTFYRPAKK